MSLCMCVCDDFEKGILACGKKETFNCPVAWPINLSLNSKHQSITLLWHFIMEQPVIWDNHLGQFSNYSTDFTLLIPLYSLTWQKNLMKSLSPVCGPLWIDSHSCNVSHLCEFDIYWVRSPASNLQFAPTAKQ